MRHEFKPAVWAFLLILSIAAAGCTTQPSKPPTTLDYLEQTEATVASLWNMLGQAIQLGTVEVNSADHMRYYTLLDKADMLLDKAWESYRGGDVAIARTQADLALAIYIELRPTLVRLAGGE